MIKSISMAMLTLGLFLVAVGFDSKESTAQAQAAGAGAKAKELVLDLGDKVTLKMVQIPAGQFTMGSPETEKETLWLDPGIRVAVIVFEPDAPGVTVIPPELDRA